MAPSSQLSTVAGSPPAPPGYLIPLAPSWSVVDHPPPQDSTPTAAPHSSVPPTLAGYSCSTLVFSRYGSTVAFQIPTSASITGAICSTLALWILCVALAHWLSVPPQAPPPPALLPSVCPLDSSALPQPLVFPTMTPPWAAVIAVSWVPPGSSSCSNSLSSPWLLPPSGQNELDPQNSDQVTRQNRIQQLEYNYSVCAKKRMQLLQEAVCALELCQASLILRIKSWRWEQHRATIGVQFDDNLGPLQTWCEQLLGVNSNLRQELMLVKRDHGVVEQFHTLQESLAHVLQTLIKNSLVVDKQPPQVIKTQSKFSTTVRYLLGEKMAPGKPVLLKAQIITEAQARQGVVPNENVGELINSTAILEHNTASKNTCATFRNMSIRKIKRADRKGSESVTEEKFALLFTTELTITGCESPYSIQAISLPVVVIVHGSQEINAMATIIWDCAFSEPDRVPFIVPERVPWKQMCEALSSKFMSEVQTQRCLDRYNFHFLAQKIFDQPDITEDFSNMPVSWAQFNKEVLPGRTFTFWQWFEGVMDLTKKCLRDYWSEGYNGGRKIQNIQPFTKKDLDSAGLGDRIRDINCITHVYPDLPKNEVFKKFFTVPSPPNPDGYLPFKLTTVVNPGDQRSTASIPPDTPMDIFGQPMSNVYGQNMNQGIFSPLPQSTPPYMPEQIPGQGPLYQSPM
ncbi:hypothetical protein cypCar_00024537 [Cyprinus carpio]|nr:hypothetical protein cypCar_00024537 [Cyprinus carpio]